MIDIAWLRHTDNRVQHQHAVDRGRSALRQRFMHAMQRIARLKGDNIPVPIRLQDGASFGGRAAEFSEIRMMRQLQYLESSRDIQLAPAMHFRDDRMTRIIFAKDLDRRLFQVPSVDLVDMLNRQDIVPAIAQGNVPSHFNLIMGFDRQGNRNGKQRAVGHTHRIQDILEVCLPHESAQWRKRPNGQ